MFIQSKEAIIKIAIKINLKIAEKQSKSRNYYKIYERSKNNTYLKYFIFHHILQKDRNKLDLSMLRI